MPDKAQLLECCRNRTGPEVRHLRVMDGPGAALCGTGDQSGAGAGSFSHLLRWPTCHGCPKIAREMGPHPRQADDAPPDLSDLGEAV